jgi:diadenosine tetraphosphate (Ap4A) HIT family hydrolase
VVTETNWLRIPAETQVESRSTWTIAINENQYLLGATVILLNRPCEAVAELTAAEWMDLHTQLRRLQRALDDLLHPDQYDHAFLTSRTHQVYLDVVPRYRSSRSWAGERFDDPDYGEVFQVRERRLPVAALQDLRDAVRARLPAVV